VVASARRKDEAQVSASSPRRKGIRRGAKLMFVSGVLFPVCLLGLIVNHGELMIIPLLIFFVSLILMLYARLFSDPTPPVKNQDAQTSGLTSMSARGSLPPASNISMQGPAKLAGQKVRTNELAQPPSVTEHTTRFLDNE
jgi:hypothetical protein